MATGDPAFEKAKSLFNLRNPEPVPGNAWQLYTKNRQTASQFPGMKEGPKDERESIALRYGETESVYVLRSIRKLIAKLEGEMGLDDEILQKSFKMLSCDALFEEPPEQPREVTTSTRIYSPTKPVYIDVDFVYHCRSRMYEIEWFYKLGFKIHTQPALSDYHPDILTQFEEGSFEDAYNSEGWRPIAYGFYDDTGKYGRSWKRVECKAFKLEYKDIVDIYEALWGSLADLPGDADEAAKSDLRRKLVDGVRLLLAAVGIDYRIACGDDEVDNSGKVYMLEGMTDPWFARETRRACGFQLTSDPEKEARASRKGVECLEEEGMRGDEDDEDSEYDDDGYGSF